MVVFVDFEGEDDDASYHSCFPRQYHTQHHVRQLTLSDDSDALNMIWNGNGKVVDKDEDRSAKLFASALACYPVSLSITAQLDLNDLYALSVTCHRIHNSLAQFAYQLRTKSLRCTFEIPPKTSEEEADAIIFQEAIGNPSSDSQSRSDDQVIHISSDNAANVMLASSASSLKERTRECARDLVAPCRKCGLVICRNCAAKPPNNRALPNRFRRLCKTCLDTPLLDHLHPLTDDHDPHDDSSGSSASSAGSALVSASQDPRQAMRTNQDPSFTACAFLRQSCNCASNGVYLCQPCGTMLTAADTTYKRVWTWRSRYSTHIGGGLGTGLGLGNQGQKCGRGEHCLEEGVGGVCWVEIECSEARAQGLGWEDSSATLRRSRITTSLRDHDGDKTMSNKPGYLSQEMEGIGGVVKKKVKKRIKVGATVYEYDDERESGKYLERESSGRQRSWCGWCSRVCLGEADRAEQDRLLGRHS